MMKLHRSLLEGIVHSLEETFNQNRKSDKVLAQLFKANRQWGARDRGFIAENTYDIVRWWRRILYTLDYDLATPLRHKQLWEVLGAWLIINDHDLPANNEWRDLPKANIKDKYFDKSLPPVIKHSIPDWLNDVGMEQLGEQTWLKELGAMNDQAPVTLRVNTFKNTRDELVQILADSGIETTLDKRVSNAIHLKKRQNIFTTTAFKEGRFEVQDAGSQMIAEFLQVGPGMRVVDACAGAGGKALLLSNLMENKGQLIALDVEGWKLDELKKRARRNGAHNIETRVIEGKTIKRLRDNADRLLLDVPCTGLGTIRRNPDAKWKLDPSFAKTIGKVQEEILANYSKILRVDGLMVYATCSILKSENEDQVAKFLSLHPNFNLVKETRTSTADTGYDGFYMALIKRIK